MAKTKKSENVPKAMEEKFSGIVAITDNFAKQHLNDEYAQIIRFAWFSSVSEKTISTGKR